MIRIIRLFSLLPFMFALGSCGFSPVYSGATGGNAPIYIHEIEGRTGYALRKALQEKLTRSMRGLEAGGAIGVELDERVERLQFRPDGFAARASLTLSAQYSLEIDGEIIPGNAKSISYFNVPPSEYGDIVVQIDARQVAANLLAEDITNSILVALAAR